MLPVDEPFVAQQLDARVVLRIALGCGLQDVVGADLDAVGRGPVDEAYKGLAGAVLRDCGPEALQLVGHEPVVAGPGPEALGREGDVAAPGESGGEVRLVGRLV